MGFRLVTKSVILNDLERRNGFYFALFAEFLAFEIYYVKWLKILRYFLRQKSVTLNDLERCNGQYFALFR